MALKEADQLGQEVDLMRLYPQAIGRLDQRPQISEEDRAISREFGLDYFDGDRRHGYGGFNYHPRFWTNTVRMFADYYKLASDSSILDIGCAKGFMLADFRVLLPDARLRGIDISSYAVSRGHASIQDALQVGDAIDLPFENASFDLVIAINTIHNLERDDVVKALQEVERVSRGNSFIMVDGWRSQSEKSALEAWVLTARTMMSCIDWVALFREAGYSGDYAFWSPL